MGMIYGYACVSSAYILRTDPDALKATKAYQELGRVFASLRLPAENIRTDLIDSLYRRRKCFEEILGSAGEGDCVVVATMAALGFKPEELRANYKALYLKNIGLYVADEFRSGKLRYSTADSRMAMAETLRYDGGPVPFLIMQNLDRLKHETFPTHQGRPFMQQPENFKRAYWLYENFFLSENQSFRNRLIDISKKRFLRLAAEYEQLDPDYEADLNEQDRLYRISQKPKRTGSVPEQFPQLLELYDQGMPAADACKKAGCRYIPPVDIERYRLKYTTGRKGILIANRQYGGTPEAKALTADVIRRGDEDKSAGVLDVETKDGMMEWSIKTGDINV